MSADPNPSFSAAESDELAGQGAGTSLAIQHYQLLRRIGEGAFGEVWIARNALGTLRAVKVVYRAVFADARDYERELTGVRNFEPVSREHVGLVDLLDVGVNHAEGYFYYAMELADDASAPGASQLPEQGDREPSTKDDPSAPCSEVAAPQRGKRPSAISDWKSYSPCTLSARLRDEGRLPLAECLRVSVALTDALEFLHGQGLIHRDIKPSNIIFVGGVPKLADVGTVTRVEDAKTMVGTEGFQAPEGPGKPQGDVYSLGKVLYEISTGKDRQRFPEPLTSLAELADRAQWQEFNAVVTKACEPDPSRRYASVTELRVDVLTIQAGRSVRRQWLLEKRFKQAVAALVVLAVLVGAGVFIQQMRLEVANARAKVERARLESEAKAASARAEEAEHRRALLELEKVIRPPHEAGWSARAWQMASNGANRFGFDTNLQSQAAGSLAGLDATNIFLTGSIGGSSVAFSPDGKRVLYGSLPEAKQTDDPGKAHLLDLDTKKLTAFPAPGSGPVAFLPGGTPVQFSADASHRLALWLVGQPSAGTAIPPVQTGPHRQHASATAASDDSIALRFFSLPNGERFTALGALAMTPDGSFVAASGASTSGRAICAVWDGTSGNLRLATSDLGTASPRASHFFPTNALAFTPDGSLLAAGDDEGGVRIWRIVDRSALPPIKASRLPILSLAFGPDLVMDPMHPAAEPQWLLAVGDSGGGVMIWRLATTELVTQCPGAQWDRAALTFSPDGTLLASGGRGTMVWDTATGRPLLTMGEEFGNGIAFSRDGARFAAATKRLNGVVSSLVYEWHDGRGIRTLRGLARPLTKVCFSRDGRLLAAVSQDWQVGLWDLSNARLLHVLSVPPGLVTADNAGLAFSHDGAKFAFMAGSRALLLGAESGECLQEWPLPPGRVDELAFDPSGLLFAFHLEPTDAAAQDFSRPTTARIRELLPDGTARPLMELPEFNRDVHGAVWSPDGSVIAIEGFGVQGEMTDRWVKVVHPLANSTLWTRRPEVAPEGPSMLAMDAGGAGVAFVPGPTSSMEICDPVSGHTDRTFQCPFHAFSSRTQLLCFGSPNEEVLIAMQDGSLLLKAQFSETKPSFLPVFSRDGNLLAWGSQDGTVSVCDLEELNRRLAEIKLDWSTRAGSLPSRKP
jgi:WD40 repeat protein